MDGYLARGRLTGLAFALVLSSLGGSAAAAGDPAFTDFEQRCAGAGVLRCEGFDTELPGTRKTTVLRGTYGKRVHPKLDAEHKASGNGSLKFTYFSKSPAGGAGMYFSRFAEDPNERVAEGEEIYIQWRQWFPPEFLVVRWRHKDEPRYVTGWKQVIIGEGDWLNESGRVIKERPAYPWHSACGDICSQYVLYEGVTVMGFKVASRVRGLSDEAFGEAFGTKEQCRAALVRLRWPGGFVCPWCGHREHCVLAGRGLYQCNRCKKQTSPTAGTIFHATKLPLTLWFAAIHLIVTAKNGISSVELGRRLGVKQPTAWAVKHKIMAVMVRRE